MNTKSFASRPARERLAASDREALADFYELYFPRVYGYVRRMVGADAEAEDVTSDVFLHLQRAIGQFDPARDPEPWVFTIATNKVRDVWRSSEHGRRQRTVSLDIPENASLVRTTEDVHSDPTRPAERAELREMLDAAIDELPQSLRRVFVLRWTEQMEFRDIARTLDRKEDAVRKRYSRALEHLRAALGGNPLVAQVGPRTPAREGASRLPSPVSTARLRVVRRGAAPQPDRSAELVKAKNPYGRVGKVKTGILLWALGIPIPFILLFLLIRSCV